MVWSGRGEPRRTAARYGMVGQGGGGGGGWTRIPDKPVFELRPAGLVAGPGTVFASDLICLGERFGGFVLIKHSFPGHRVMWTV